LLSPEAQAAVAAFERVSSNLSEQIAGSSSGKEKISRGEEVDLRLATELNTSDCVPILFNGAFTREA
jgi:2-phosphosulfolactate phosphatase